MLMLLLLWNVISVVERGRTCVRGMAWFSRWLLMSGVERVDV